VNPSTVNIHDGHSALIEASREGYSRIVLLLVRAGAELESRATPRLLGPDYISSPARGWTALQFAVYSLHPAIVEILLNGGAYIHTRDSTGRTPLITLVRRRYISVRAGGDSRDQVIALKDEVADLLLSRGSKATDVDDRNISVLHESVRVSTTSVHIIHMLLERGADVNQTTGSFMTPLMYAVQKDRPEVVDMLLRRGANINARRVDGDTALTEALIYHRTRGPYEVSHGRQIDNTETIRLLLRYGADPNLRSTLGAPPLGEAASIGDAYVVRMLLTSRADVDMVDGHGYTPLMIAASFMRKSLEDIVRILIQAGADIDLTNPEGETAEDIAKRNGQVEIRRILVEEAQRRRTLGTSGTSGTLAEDTSGEKVGYSRSATSPSPDYEEMEEMGDKEVKEPAWLMF